MEMEEFTIRVYGIIIENDHICLSREEIRGQRFVKFPGGGLEYGEGTRECLQREIQEETGLSSRIKEHFYTTDFFQPSQFHDHPVQVLSIYYFATLINPEKISGMATSEGGLGIFWLPLSELKPETLDLPIDQVVVKKLEREGEVTRPYLWRISSPRRPLS